MKLEKSLRKWETGDERQKWGLKKQQHETFYMITIAGRTKSGRRTPEGRVSPERKRAWTASSFSFLQLLLLFSVLRAVPHTTSRKLPFLAPTDGVAAAICRFLPPSLLLPEIRERRTLLFLVGVGGCMGCHVFLCVCVVGVFVVCLLPPMPPFFDVTFVFCFILCFFIPHGNWVSR